MTFFAARCSTPDKVNTKRAQTERETQWITCWYKHATLKMGLIDAVKRAKLVPPHSQR